MRSSNRNANDNRGAGIISLMSEIPSTDLECSSCHISVQLLEGREWDGTSPILCDPCAQDEVIRLRADLEMAAQRHQELRSRLWHLASGIRQGGQPKTAELIEAILRMSNEGIPLVQLLAAERDAAEAKAKQARQQGIKECRDLLRSWASPGWLHTIALDYAVEQLNLLLPTTLPQCLNCRNDKHHLHARWILEGGPCRCPRCEPDLAPYPGKEIPQ
jgi:hypothetical protein